jgi:phospholipid/cholesterol/gamma-HCH transport system substrate-binding protein
MSFRHRLPSSAPKFLVFALVCVVLLVGLAVRIGNISLFSHRHALSAQLADVTGLASGDPVTIAGVRVGQVSGIGVQRGHALVSMSINNSVSLHQSSDIGVRWQNVIGEKGIEIFPGKEGSVLPTAATIPLSHDVSDASVNAFLNSLGPLLSSINPKQANEFVENVSGALEGDTAQINQLIDNGAIVSDTVGALDSQVGQIIGNLNQVLTAIASRSGDLGSLVDNLQTVSASLASKNTLLDSVVGNLSGVASDLAQLIGSNHSTITSTIDNLSAVATDVQNNQKALSDSLSSLGTGLAPYVQISQWGQWFAVQTVYTCLANQTACTYYQPGNAPAGSGPLGSPPLGGGGSTSNASAGGGSGDPSTTASPLSSASKSAASSPLAASSIADDLGAVAGQVAPAPSPTTTPTPAQSQSQTPTQAPAAGTVGS